MDKNKSTMCVRCGKQRIVLSVEEETVGNSVIITKETICPDPECQEKVAKMLQGEQAKRVQSVLQRQERMSGKKHTTSR